MAEQAGKRTYTVPVLLIIIVVIAILFVLVYSKLLLAQQNEKTATGTRLAEQYNYALLFADRLGTGADLLLNGNTEADKLKGKHDLGAALTAAGETTGLLTEAAFKDGGKSRKETAEPILLAMNAIIGLDGKLNGIGEHDGPLTEDEKAVLTIVQAGASKLDTVLSGFRVPSGEAGFRQMSDGGDWVAAALEAKSIIEQIAAELKEI